MKRVFKLLMAFSVLVLVAGPGIAVADDDWDDDGIPNDEDQCPVTPEDYDGHEDWDGCPETDDGNTCIRLPCP